MFVRLKCNSDAAWRNIKEQHDMLSVWHASDPPAGVKGTPMPHKVPITVAVGRPLQVPHVASPTPEQVRTRA